MPTVEYMQPAVVQLIWRRVIAAAVGLAALALLVTAARLEPAADGDGTHTQLGLPACNLKQTTGYPCPTCGCTTAFSHAAHGRLFTALATQPFGAIAALLTAMAVIGAGYVTVSGADIGPWVKLAVRRPVLWGMLAVFVVSWLYKIALTIGASS